MFTYSSELGNCAIVHLTIPETVEPEKARLLCSYLRGTTWAAPPSAAPLLDSLKAFEVAYSKPVVYLNDRNATGLFQKQMTQGLYEDKVSDKHRQGYLKHEVTVCKTPLEVISAAVPNANDYGLVHVLAPIKSLVDKAMGAGNYKSIVVFINCFDTMPEFVDVSYQLA